MSSVDVTLVVIAHDESVVAGPTMKAADIAVASARREGYRVQTIIALAEATKESTDYFHQSRFDHWERLVMNEGDLGQVRNLIVPQTEGRYIAFLDADVLLSENWLAEGAAALDVVGERGERAIAVSELTVLFDGAKSILQNVDSSSPMFTPHILYLDNCHHSPCLTPRQAHLDAPYAQRDIANGLSHPDWQFAIETLAQGWRHLVVPDTITFNRGRDAPIATENNSRRSLVRSLPEMAIDRVRDVAR